MRKCLDKTGERVSQHKRAYHGFFGSTNAHFMSKYEKEKNTCSDSQRHFATRKIKVECGKAWGFCALGQEEVHWAYIYSKARTAWGFARPWQHWGSWPDPNSLLFTSNNHIPFANNLPLKFASPFVSQGKNTTQLSYTVHTQRTFSWLFLALKPPRTFLTPSNEPVEIGLRNSYCS